MFNCHSEFSLSPRLWMKVVWSVTGLLLPLLCLVVFCTVTGCGNRPILIHYHHHYHHLSSVRLPARHPAQQDWFSSLRGLENGYGRVFFILLCDLFFFFLFLSLISMWWSGSRRWLLIGCASLGLDSVSLCANILGGNLPLSHKAKRHRWTLTLHFCLVYACHSS